MKLEIAKNYVTRNVCIIGNVCPLSNEVHVIIMKSIPIIITKDYPTIVTYLRSSAWHSYMFQFISSEYTMIIFYTIPIPVFVYT